MNIFIAGSDTDVGKTVVSAALCLKLNWKYWKPVQSGTLVETDTERCSRFLRPDQIIPETYRLTQPLSPHESAKLDDCEISLERLQRHASLLDSTVIEGAGGLLVPFSDSYLQIELIERLALPVLLVARSTIGTINHTLLSIQALRMLKINLLGVILIGPPHPHNARAIENFGKTQILGEIPIFILLDLKAFQMAGDLIHFPAEDALSSSGVSPCEPLPQVWSRQ